MEQGFPDEGFAIVDDVFSDIEVDALTQRMTGIKSVGTRRLLDHDWCQHLVDQLRQRLMGTAPELASLVAVQCTYFNKSAKANWFVSFHQDQNVLASEQVSRDFPGWTRKEGVVSIQPSADILSRLMAVRLHLDHSDNDNGPLRVIPGTHRFGSLTADEIQTHTSQRQPTELIVRRGGVILLSPLLLHASSKSKTGKDRRVLHFLFGPTRPMGRFSWRWAI